MIIVITPTIENIGYYVATSSDWEEVNRTKCTSTCFDYECFSDWYDAALLPAFEFPDYFPIDAFIKNPLSPANKKGIPRPERKPGAI